MSGREIVGFDTLGAPFWYDASGFAGVAGASSPVARLRGLMAAGAAEPRHDSSVDRHRWRLGLYESPSNSESGLLNLVENAATLTLRTRPGLEATAFAVAASSAQEAPVHGAVLAWRPSDGPFGLRVGWLAEPGAMLGTEADGAFGNLSADSAMVGLEAGAEVAGWRIAADAELGLVAPGMGNGMVEDMSGLTTSALSLRAKRRPTGNDEIAVSRNPGHAEAHSALSVLAGWRATF